VDVRIKDLSVAQKRARIINFSICRLKNMLVHLNSIEHDCNKLNLTLYYQINCQVAIVRDEINTLLDNVNVINKKEKK